ncbi:Small heat shock protein C4 [Grifola frondosa]|uniref:Small heat shock protein C4 n=1 Tax=Grifola frondosa TaxID=5627 RepID=A0A1C7MDA5_GRIFR|nr:Small heat shock protein C4 [Grifola frondosa]
MTDLWYINPSTPFFKVYSYTTFTVNFITPLHSRINMSLSTFFNEPFYSASDFDRLFDQAFNARSAVQPRQNVNTAPRPLRPRLDYHEDEAKNLVTATFELPGLTKGDVQIDVQDNVLTVSGESTVSPDRDEKGYAVRERRYGKFSRSLLLPQGIKRRNQGGDGEWYPDHHVPKVTAEQVPKKITIA